jgi:hypothetical protein
VSRSLKTLQSVTGWMKNSFLELPNYAMTQTFYFNQQNPPKSLNKQTIKPSRLGTLQNSSQSFIKYVLLTIQSFQLRNQSHTTTKIC